MAWSKWIDLAMPEMTGDMPFDMAAPKGPRYPYGMRLTLDNHCLDCADLELADLAVGAEIDIRAFGKVVVFSDENGQRSVSIQLTRIKVENEDDEDEPDDEET
jgi:hypothetical protein